MKRALILLLILTMIVPLVPAVAQGDCAGDPLLEPHRHGVVLPGMAALLYSAPGSTETIDQLAEGTVFQTIDGPQCTGGAWWWMVTDGNYWDVWTPETVNGTAAVAPYQFVPPVPEALNVPMQDPVISTPDVPLPAAIPAEGVPSLQNGFTQGWDWAGWTADKWQQPPDPLAMQLPDEYLGDLPVPPVDLNNVHFVTDANLSQEQLALLAQNGFVVVPGSFQQFDEAYRADTWNHTEGKGDFITTDAMLHSLFLVYQNTLMFLEMDPFYREVGAVAAASYQAAEAQWIEAAGTPVEDAARSAAIYYAVPLMLLAEGEPYYTIGFTEGDIIPSIVLANANADIVAAAQPLVDQIMAAEGRLEVPILADYTEDFSQYKPRSYYAGNPLLEAYFRAMMWMGRITFLANNDADTLTGLMVQRALINGGALARWQNVSDTLAFLVGPVDDLSPDDTLPLAESIYGAGLPLDTLANADNLAAYRDALKALPGPRVNSIVLPLGVEADEVDALTRGVRLFGQRFTLDAYVMQQLIYPEVGTQENSRALPMALDVASALGSDIAYALADEAGAADYAHYTDNMAALRDEVNALTPDAWMENLYGGWLWAMQPLLVRDPALTPPMMQTDAWKRKDINSAIGSWVELKHATLLYAEQAMGGLGGGGIEPPITSYTSVEPNPQVFARIAVVAVALQQGLEARGYFGMNYLSPMPSVRSALTSLALLSAQLAEMARKEVAGEPLSYEELYFLQENFDGALWNIRYTVEEWVTDPPETVALVADVASNPNAGLVLEEAIGGVDTIYVITNSPFGLQLTRGGVYSTYEFTMPIDQRLTDDDWRAMVAQGQAPERPAWTDLYLGE
jgi:hypothetical protein